MDARTASVTDPALSLTPTAPAAQILRRVRNSWAARHWIPVPVVLGVGLFTLNVLPVYPGFMSTDTIAQLDQAMDPAILDDWHPPVMTALWWLLMKLPFGGVGNMLVAQLFLLWASLTLLAVYVFQRSGRRRFSLIPLLIGVLPFVAGTSAAIWKDSQLAFALLGAVVLLVLVRRGIRRAALQWSAVVVAVLLLAYAGAVRYNALPAIIPLLFLFVRPDGRRSRRYAVLLAGAAVIGALVATPVIDVVRPVQATHPAASIMLDDVMHLYSARELAESDVSPVLRDQLVARATACPPDTRDVNYTWRCANSGGIPPFFATHPEELRDLYVSGIVDHPVRYAKFRLRVFADFLHDPPEDRYIARFAIRDNPYGVSLTPNLMTRGLEYYVDATNRNVGFVFMPWTWLLAALAVTVLAWRRRATFPHAGVVMALGTSGAIYVLTYVPMVIGYDYRYVYWSVVAVSAASVLLLLDWRTAGAEALQEKHQVEVLCGDGATGPAPVPPAAPAGPPR
jgi:hypothetical protein